MPCACGQHKTPQGCAGAKALQRLTREQRQLGGFRGGKAHASKWKREIEARLARIEQALRFQCENTTT